ncbi:nicotinamidase-related amidase [Nocardiopsis sp. Huas11]|uniref:isochorismatase family protein n=1 Tax=Nocardiopsis sp. Huas11 TaxID=2183912 RepID=UPI000EABFF8C|nr:isochorismatase family protein [Nocardiopsis sp. Huas11]RKS09949.1 nicotinamidase-related amidase [Nocardiopsis sp. Huas11]
MSFALMFVDVQRNMLEGEFPVPEADAVRPVLSGLLSRARAAGAPVVHVLNDGSDIDPDRPHTPGWQPVFAAEPGEPVFRKTEPNAFSVPGLAASLNGFGVRTLVVAGFQSEFCIAATSRAALEEGYDVVLAAGAHATYPGSLSAPETAATVERELQADGIKVSPAQDLVFR